MDAVVEVSRSFLNRIMAVLRSFTHPCETCYRASCDCYFSNEITRAKEMMRELDGARGSEEERFFVSNPAEEFVARVLKAVRQGGGENVRSDEIKLKGESRQRKARALKSLVKRGLLVKSYVGGIPTYSISGNGKNNNNKPKGERHGV